MATPNVPEPVYVTIPKKLRDLFKWVDEAAAKSRQKKELACKKKLKTKGPELSSEKLFEDADELERTQRSLNPLKTALAKFVLKIKAHWAHTGIEEINSPLGNTKITTSMSISFNSNGLRDALPYPKWKKISERVANAHLTLLEAESDPEIRAAAERNIVVSSFTVSVIAPSSQTARDGELGEDAKDE